MGDTISKIDYQTNEKVLLTYPNGTWVLPDAVIVTIPLGVLQNQQVEFTPELPSEKIKAMEGLTMGVVNKVAMSFEKVFWGTENELFGF